MVDRSKSVKREVLAFSGAEIVFDVLKVVITCFAIGAAEYLTITNMQETVVVRGDVVAAVLLIGTAMSHLLCKIITADS